MTQTLDALPASNFVKTIVVGFSGGRKTTGLASLVRAGYRLWILDFDNGLGALARELAPTPHLLKRISFVTLRDKLKQSGGRIVADGTPKAWSTALQYLTNWPDKGPLEKWTDEDVLVIDSLTLAGDAALRHMLFTVGRELAPQQQDWGAAMGSVEGMIKILTSPACNCHVVVNTHVNYTENADGSGVIEGFPSALGNKLSPKLPVYFDNTIVAMKKGSGDNAVYTYELRGTNLINGKSSYRAAASLPNATGLADFFRELRGGKVPPPPPTK